MTKFLRRTIVQLKKTEQVHRSEWKLNADLEGLKYRQRLKGWARWYADESVDHDELTATAAALSTDSGARAAERLSFPYSATAEQTAFGRTRSLAEAESVPDRLVIVSDSKAALTQLANWSVHHPSRERWRKRRSYCRDKNGDRSSDGCRPTAALEGMRTRFSWMLWPKATTLARPPVWLRFQTHDSW